MNDQVSPRSYNLTRNFAISALVVLVLAAVSLVYVNRASSESQLQRMADQNNAALTQVFANSLWPRFRHFIEAAHVMSADQIRQHPRTADLHEQVARIMAGTRVLKVKFYDLNGLTVFSTAPEQIGKGYKTNPRYMAVLAGQPAAKLEFRAKFGAIDGPKENIWILSSYIPVRPADQDGEIEGVAEIYSDVTDFHAYARQSESTLMAVFGFGFLMVFIILLAIVWYADRQIRRYHNSNLDLAANYARADAANKAKSTFLANISHELRTPLNAIIGFSDFIKSGVYGPIGSEKYLEVATDINSSGHHLLEILNDVLDLVTLEAGDMPVACAPVDTAGVIKEVTGLLAQKAEDAQVRLETEIGAGSTVIDSDEARIRQILFNLATNAIDFTPPDGRVTLRVREEPGDGPLTRRIVLVVSDTGIGIKPEDIAKALAPFSQIDDSLTRQRDGTGLGLTLSRDFAVLLGGTLDIDGNPDGGTRITITLPEYWVGRVQLGVRPAA